ncbi:MAG: TonB-dependent receptor [Bdellovibrionota bacterium]
MFDINVFLSRIVYQSTIFVILNSIFLDELRAQRLTVDSDVQMDSSAPQTRSDLDVVVIDREYIEKSGLTSVEQLLAEQGAIHVVHPSGDAGGASIFMHGMGSDRILITVDGVKVNDPISPTRGYDFTHMPLDGIERIEILKGSVGSITGGNTLGGAINIVTRLPDRSRLFSIKVEGGSENTFLASTHIGKQYKLLSYSLSLEHALSDGISAAEGGKAGSEGEKDGFNHSGVATKIDYKISQSSQMGMNARYSQHHAEIDSYSGKVIDDPNNTVDTETVTGKLYYSFRSAPELSHTIQTSGIKVIRNYKNLIDSANPIEEDGHYTGQSTDVSLKSKVDFKTQGIASFDIGYNEERGDSQYSSQGSLVLDDRFAMRLSNSNHLAFQYSSYGLNPFVFGLAGRVEDHSRVGKLTSSHISSSYKLFGASTLLRAQLGTGYKIPSLFQLYSMFGNSDLKSEKSLAWSIGIEQHFSFFELKVSAFRNLISDLIDYDLVQNQYLNIGAADLKGVDTDLIISPVSFATLTLSYARLWHRDLQSNSPMLRRPSYKAGLDLTGFVAPRVKCSTSVTRVGMRNDNDFSAVSPTVKTLDPYTLISAKLSYSLMHGSEFYVRGENLTDEDYVEVWGYATPGSQIFAGGIYSF